MSIEKLGVRVANPDLTIAVPGTAYAELVLFEHLRTENLRRCLMALAAVDPDGANELLADVAAQLQMMANASSGVLGEHLRVAQLQGLRFELLPGQHDLH